MFSDFNGGIYVIVHLDCSLMSQLKKIHLQKIYLLLTALFVPGSFTNLLSSKRVFANFLKIKFLKYHSTKTKLIILLVRNNFKYTISR